MASRLYGGELIVDKDDSTIDIANHDGSAAGLRLGGTLVTATAAEINASVDGLTATAAEVNAVADVSANGSVVKTQTLALTAGTHGTGSEVDTSITLPAKCVVLDIMVDVTTAESTASTKTIDIGTNNAGSDDPDGFADALSVVATGIIRPQATVTTGLNETYYSANTRGVLLSDFLVGTDAASDFGVYREKPAVGEGGAEISITSAEAFTEFAGTLIVHYIEVA